MDGVAIFHQGSYRYRRVHFLIIGVLMLAVSILPLIVLFTPHPKEASFLQMLGAAAFLLLFTVVFGWVGGAMVYYFFKDHRVELVIDRDGIAYGKDRFTWSDIASLRCLRFRTSIFSQYRIQLFLHRRLRRGRLALSRDRFLMTDSGLTAEQSHALLLRLQQEIAPAHPHLALA